MLAIRLIAEPDRLDVLVLPVRPAESTAEGDTSAEPMSTAVAAPDGTDDEAAALASAARLTGRAGEIHTHGNTILDRGLGGGHHPLALMERQEFRIAQAHLALAQAQLRQPRAGPNRRDPHPVAPRGYPRPAGAARHR